MYLTVMFRIEFGTSKIVKLFLASSQDFSTFLLFAGEEDLHFLVMTILDCETPINTLFEFEFRFVDFVARINE